MKKIREEKGITLVALIITIIVLLILAVVAINAVTGDGIIQHASNAKTSYENAQAVENSKIGEYEAFLDKHNPNKKLITFKCMIVTSASNGIATGETYELTAEEGMTWYEWCKNSKYNTIGLTCESNNSRVIGFCEGITGEDGHIKNKNTFEFVIGSEKIIDAEEYASYRFVGD